MTPELGFLISMGIFTIVVIVLAFWLFEKTEK